MSSLEQQAFGPLITADELALQLAQSDDVQRPVVVDCRFSLTDPSLGQQQYREGHIPGAYYAHLDHDLAGPIVAGETGRHPLPDVDEFARFLARLGITANSRVIAYDSAGGAIAARLWWLLHWVSHPHVAVLDGGVDAWTQAGLPLASDQPKTTEERPRALQPRTELVLSTEEVVARLEERGGRADLTLIDSREAARFRGESEPIDRQAGHIPGALNRPFAENLERGYFKSSARLRQEFDRLLGTSAEAAVFYCGSGVTATHNLLAMVHAGWAQPRLYNGSWSEWIADPGRPIATARSTITQIATKE